jgi:hypothetical protein
MSQIDYKAFFSPKTYHILPKLDHIFEKKVNFFRESYMSFQELA